MHSHFVRCGCGSSEKMQDERVTRVEVDNVAVHHVVADEVFGPSCGAGAPLGSDPALLVSGPSANVYHVDLDQMLGPSYDAVGPGPLPAWVDPSSGDAVVLTPTSVEDNGPSEASSNGLVNDTVDGDDAPPLQPAAAGPAPARAARWRRGGARARRDPQRPPGFPNAGSGRRRGSALDVRESMRKVLVILFCRQIIASLEQRTALDAAGEALLGEAIMQVKIKRDEYRNITNEMLATKAWTLRRSGCVGALFQFKDIGARDRLARDCNLAIELYLSATDELVVTCSRSAEDCLSDGCIHH